VGLSRIQELKSSEAILLDDLLKLPAQLIESRAGFNIGNRLV
jgi:hypothetical protein